MTILNKDAILQANDLPTRDEPVPEWGGTVRVRTLTGTEREAFSAELAEATRNGGAANAQGFTTRLCAWCLVGEDGQRLFTADDVRALANKSSVALERVAAAAMALNGMGARAVEDARGN